MSTKEKGGKKYIFDNIRKKYLVLQPEEFVRQLCIAWLIHTGINRNNIQVEKAININGLLRRFDIVVYDKSIKPYILVECKSPDVTIDQATFDQISAYQVALNAPYLMVTNGVKSYITQLNHVEKTFYFFDAMPDWRLL
ncbi:MAG: type I restriction enzyme HsdR N-terminal domain-containing protein [Saprospiraceae bacterium]|nr:type I restriction enzyme HsdR N-terminal domain-containing protein [Saprospiraceae bacterium]